MKTGQKVKFIESSEEQVNWGGNDDPLEAGLNIGDEYIISDVDEHNWHTKIHLEGFEGQFNSVCFDAVPTNIQEGGGR